MKTVLLVEDEDLTREMFARIIRRQGFNVLCAGCGQQAIDIYLANRADCVLLDLGLPDMSGLNVLKHIRANDDTAKVFILTGYADRDLKQQAFDLGCLNYINKPLQLEDLIEILKQVNNG